jgi:hypothetical protein
VGQALGEFTVVGEDDEPLGVVIEAAGGVQSRLHLVGKNVVDGPAALGIAPGADNLPRLVDQVGPFPAGCWQGFAVNGDPVFLRVHQDPHGGDHLAIDGHPAGRDHVLSGPAGGEPRFGNGFVEANRFHDLS